jgi:IS1 family transposase
MNRLPIEKRIQIINLLVEGNSLRATSRIADVSITTITKLLIETGSACMNYHNKMVKNLICKRVECDEIWSFVYSKQKNTPHDKTGAGDIWTWVAIDPDTKLVVSWFVGSRDDRSANLFMRDLSTRIDSHVQITTDGFKSYSVAAERYFDGRADYAQLFKEYKESTKRTKSGKKYDMGTVVGVHKIKRFGTPDSGKISTSLVERQNLTMRMHIKRFSRQTNAFSKKVENHIFAIALHFVYYNFCRIHSSIRVTPAMEAGLTKDFLSFKDIVNLSSEF